MTVSLIVQESSVGSGDRTFTTAPDSIATGDLLFVSWSHRTSTRTLTVSGTGWNTILNEFEITNLNARRCVAVAWKVAASGDVNLDVTVGWSSSATTVATMSVFRSTAGTAWALDASGTAETAGTAAATTLATASVTPTNAEGLVVAAGVFRHGASATYAFPGVMAGTSFEASQGTIHNGLTNQIGYEPLTASAAVSDTHGTLPTSQEIAGWIGAWSIPTGGTNANAGSAAASATAYDATVTTSLAATTELAAATATANDTSATATANAGSATATATAYDATVTTDAGTNAPAEAATAAATANAATPALTATAATSTATATADNATTALTAPAEQASATATVNDPTPATAPNAEQAAATVTAYDATVTASGATNAPAEQATGTATAYDATVTTDANAATATSAATAYDATVTTATATTAPAESAAATATADNATTALTASAETSAAAATAYDATVTTTAATNAPAETATATATAYDATVAITITADVATATGQAYTATVSITAIADVATVTATANDPTGLTGEIGNAEQAAASATANNATVTLTTNAGVATATAAAYNVATIEPPESVRRYLVAPQLVDSGPGELDINGVYRGDDWALTVTMVDEFGGVVDVSARTYVALVETLAKVSETTMTVDATDAATGVIVLSLTDAQTLALTSKVYHWDLKETDAATLITTVLAGRLYPTRDLAI